MQKKKGFTLVELLVTICVISILSTVSVFGYYGYVHRNNLKLDELEVEQANKALEAYFVKHSNHLTSAKDVRDAIYETTKGNFDLDTFTLRSQEKDYHLFYNTEENKLEILKGIPQAKKEQKQTLKKSVNLLPDKLPSFNKYATIDSFLWTTETPYLFVTQPGDFGSYLHKLNSGEYNRSNTSLWNVLEEKHEQKYFDAIQEHYLVLRDTDDQEDHSGSFFHFKEEVTRKVEKTILFASSVDTLKKDTISPEVLEHVNMTFPDNIDIVFDNALGNASENNYYTANENFTFNFNAFGTPANLYIDTVFDDGLKNHIAPLKMHQGTKVDNILTIYYNHDTYQLYGDELINLSRPQQSEYIAYPEENLEHINAFIQDVTFLRDTLKENRYDLFQAVTKENKETTIDQLIRECDHRYQNLEFWEKDYLTKHHQDLYAAFYNNTGDHLSLNTGIFDRLSIYERKIEQIKEKASLISVDDFGTSDSLDLVVFFRNNNIVLSDETSTDGVCFKTLFTMTQKGNITIDMDRSFIYLPNEDQAGVVLLAPRNRTDHVEIPFSFSGYAAIHTSLTDMTVGKEFDLYIYTNAIYDKFKDEKVENIFRLGALAPYYQDNLSETFQVKNEKTGKNVQLYRMHFNLPNAMELKEYEIFCGEYVSTEKMNIRVKDDATSLQLNPTSITLKDNAAKDNFITCDITFDPNDSYYVIDKDGKVNYHVHIGENNPQMNFYQKNFNGNGCIMDASKVTYQDNKDKAKALIYAEEAKIERLHIKLQRATDFAPYESFEKAASGIKGHNATIDHVSVEGGLAGICSFGDVNGKPMEVKNSFFRGNVASVLAHQDSQNKPNIVKLQDTVIDTKISDSTAENVLSRGVATLYYPSEDGIAYDALSNVDVSFNNTTVYGWAKVAEVKKTYGILTKGLLHSFLEENFKEKLDEMIADHWFVMAGPYWKREETLKGLIDVSKKLGDQIFTNCNALHIPMKAVKYDVTEEYSNLVCYVPSYLYAGITKTVNKEDTLFMEFGNADVDKFGMSQNTKQADTQSITEMFLKYLLVEKYYWHLNTTTDLYFRNNDVYEGTWSAGPITPSDPTW